MKKVLGWLVVVLLAAVASGCSGDKDPNTNKDKDKPKPAEHAAP